MVLVPRLLVDVRVGLQSTIAVHPREKSTEDNKTAQWAGRIISRHIVDRSK